MTAQQLFKELDAGKFLPLYLVVGEEPFQWNEIVDRFKAKVLQGEVSDFQFETWDGEGLDGGGLKASLEELPGLFAEAHKLVICRGIEKAAVAALQTMESYFESPVDSSVLVMSANKVDKRKGWVKALEKRAGVIEIAEPHDREWPKWQGYLEKRCGKRIQPEAWELLVSLSQKRLSLLWAELTKTATYVGDNALITAKDVIEVSCGESGEDVFSFAEAVLLKNREAAFQKFHNLMRQGESEIKVLSILVRQFRIVDQYRRLSMKGVTDSKIVGPQIGVHPFFVSKIADQAKRHDLLSLQAAIERLSEADYKLKTGGGALFESFLLPYLTA